MISPRLSARRPPWYAKSRKVQRLLLCGPLLLVLLALISVDSLSAAVTQLSEEEKRTVRYKVEAYKHYNGVGRPVNYARAQGLYLMAAKRGDAEAQFIVGGMLYRGQGTDPDRRRAFKWLVQAAKQGKYSPESLQIIGSMYLRGDGVPQSYEEAKKWLVPAAAANNLAAINDLAFVYYHGLDGKKDPVKALELYTRAAMQNDSLAQANTGLMHAAGIGTAKDLARGYAWYSLAASKGNTTARVNRNSLMAEMSWEDLQRAQAISVELYQEIERITAGKETPGLR